MFIDHRRRAAALRQESHVIDRRRAAALRQEAQTEVYATPGTRDTSPWSSRAPLPT
jgi:hypothetical protein